MTPSPPFTWQLDDGGYTLELRRDARPGPAPGAGPAILLVSRSADAEFDLLGKRLSAAGLPVARLDAETITRTGLVIDLDRRAVLVAGSWITPTVTWLRHFSRRAMPNSDDRLRAAFAADSWEALAGQLGVVSASTIRSAGPGLLAQLNLARSLGIAVPRTVVTTDLGPVRDLLASPTVVIKALHEHFVEVTPGQLSGVFAEIVSRDALGPGQVPPVVVQEYVRHDTEFRVYCLRDQIVAAYSITKADPADPWTNPGRVGASLVDSPPRLADAVRSLAAAMSIDFGAFDFLMAGGTPVFLEVNLAGDWRWLESKAGASPVTDASARLLASLHREAATTPLPGRVDPVTFLTGKVSRSSP